MVGLCRFLSWPTKIQSPENGEKIWVGGGGVVEERGLMELPIYPLDPIEMLR